MNLQSAPVNHALPPDPLVPSVLKEYGAITRAALKDYLPSAEPREYLYDLVSDYPTRGGKMMRPSICIATARAFGGRIEDAILCAVSLELLHNALLIHDDIEDESEVRRGKPTMHVLHGIPLAVNVGDTLTLLSIRPLIDNRDVLGPYLTLKVLSETERVAIESAEGQALELGWRRDNAMHISEADYLEMVLKKTCWLATIYPTRVGALVGTRREVAAENFVRFGFFLGAAFQIQDDLLNLFADVAYGKERDGDIWEGKRTLMLLRLIGEASDGERERLAQVLDTPREDKREADVAWIRRKMDDYGCIDYARQVAHGLAGAALEEFNGAFASAPPSRDKAFIEQLATWVFQRN